MTCVILVILAASLATVAIFILDEQKNITIDLRQELQRVAQQNENLTIELSRVREMMENEVESNTLATTTTTTSDSITTTNTPTTTTNNNNNNITNTSSITVTD